jgi:hypothetical protein
VLGDTTCLALGYGGGTEGVEESCLTMVDMAHYGYHWGSGRERGGVGMGWTDVGISKWDERREKGTDDG